MQYSLTFVLFSGLHGKPNLSDDFIAQSAYDIIAPSYGNDPLESYASLANKLAADLPKHKSYIFIGESFGGPLAVLCAQLLPKQVKAIVFVASFIKDPSPSLLHNIPSSFLKVLPMRSSLPRIFLGGFKREVAFDKKLKETLLEVGVELFLSRVNQIRKVNLTKVVEQLDVPMLYLAASKDYLIPNKAINHIRQSAKRALAIQCVEGPHLILQTKPRASWRAILTFVEKHVDKH